jgi:hypothetical protein
MYQVLCERCWHTEDVEADRLPDHACPSCNADRSWLGPFAEARDRFARRESWPVLASALYAHAGQVVRRARPH